MDPTDLGIFRLAEQRLAWVDQRQRLLAQNIANADTPGFQSQDVAPFGLQLHRQSLAVTSSGHLSTPTGETLGVSSKPKSRAPSGNVVSIEDQLSRVADTAGVQELVLNLHHRYQAMLRTAFGRAG